MGTTSRHRNRMLSRPWVPDWIHRYKLKICIDRYTEPTSYDCWCRKPLAALPAAYRCRMKSGASYLAPSQILYSSHFVSAKHWSTYQSCISGVAVVPWSWLIIRITSTNIQPWDIIEWNLSSVWTDQHRVLNTRHMFCYCPDEMTVTPTTFIMVKGGSKKSLWIIFCFPYNSAPGNWIFEIVV